MSHIARRFSHEKRVVHLARVDPDLVLHYDFLQASGSTMDSVAVRAPTLVFTRASDASSFRSDGTFGLVGFVGFLGEGPS